VLEIEHAVRRAVVDYYHTATDVVCVHCNQIPFFEC
jgi:hypothetical protein